MLSLLLIIPLIQKNTFLIDDKHFHLLRIQGIYDSFKIGEFFPRIYESIFYGYGYGSPLFYPDIFLYFPAFLTYLGLNLTVSYDVFLFSINIFTALISFYSFKKISNNRTQAFWFSFLYLYFPYRLINFYIRNAVGELLASMFFPLVLLFIYKLIKEKKCSWIVLTIAMVGILNSHIISVN